jgi:CRP-like cAMP-binding protein
VSQRNARSPSLGKPPAVRGRPGAPAANYLLAGLPVAEGLRLHHRSTLVEFGLGEILHEPHVRLTAAYFPEVGAFSLLTILANGTAVETGLVGREGMIGLPLFLGEPRSQGLAMCQIPGAVLRVPAAALQEAARRGGALDARLRRYTIARLAQLAQSVACNAEHSITERCARWLLLTHDRATADDFPLTQEFLAGMLGVRRATVSVVESRLQDAGLIRYHHGHVTVDDRAGLEAAACECYVAGRAESDAVMPGRHA